MVVRGGKFEPVRCKECVADSVALCEVDNGYGEKKCGKDEFYGTCLVTACDPGYIINSGSNSCRSFLNLSYFVVYICSGLVGLALICLVTSIFTREKISAWAFARESRDKNGVRIKYIFLIINLNY